jgi:hypothetical protein
MSKPKDNNIGHDHSKPKSCYVITFLLSILRNQVLHLTTTCEHINEEIIADEECMETVVGNALGELMLQQPAQSLALRHLRLSLGWYGMAAETTLFKAVAETSPLLQLLELGRTLQPFKFGCLESLVPQLHKMKHLTALKLHLAWVSCLSNFVTCMFPLKYSSVCTTCVACSCSASQVHAPESINSCITACH